MSCHCEVVTEDDMRRHAQALADRLRRPMLLAERADPCETCSRSRSRWSVTQADAPKLAGWRTVATLSPAPR